MTIGAEQKNAVGGVPRTYYYNIITRNDVGRGWAWGSFAIAPRTTQNGKTKKKKARKTIVYTRVINNNRTSGACVLLSVHYIIADGAAWRGARNEGKTPLSPAAAGIRLRART